MSTPTFTPAELAQFIGTTQYYRHPLNRQLLYTDGCHHLVENGAAWLVNDIAIVQAMAPEVANERFVSVTAKPDGKGGAVVRYTDGDYTELYEQEYPASDLPCEVTFFHYNNTLMLGSEY